MRRPTSNIIPFPGRHKEDRDFTPVTNDRSKRLEKFKAAAKQNATSRSQVIPKAFARCSANSTTPPDPAVVAQIVIGFARRKGIAMTSIPQTFRQQLLALCEAGDPTALMLRDWLSGNRQFMPHEIGEGA